MKQYLSIGFRAKWVLLLSSFSVFTLLSGVSLAESLTSSPVSLLRDVPLKVDSYTDILADTPARLSTASEILQVINNTPNLLIHMELLRRGYHELSEAEQSRLMERLEERHQDSDKDMIMAFDYGYGQLVYLNNKSGLYFLRKANDTFESQFTSLAYGMAQVDTDLNLENMTPSQMTTRKLDAIYKLGDSVKLDAARHQSGFWPSFIGVIERIKHVEAYKNFSNRDFSLAYVPYGSITIKYNTAANTNKPVALTTTQHVAANNPTEPEITETELPSIGRLIQPEASLQCKADLSLGDDAVERTTLSSGQTATVVRAYAARVMSAAPSALLPSQSGLTPEIEQAGKTLLMERTFQVDGVNTTLRFYPGTAENQYQVQVETDGKAPFTFDSYVMPGILEDLDRDGQFEIVVRQYRHEPLKPVLVYRYYPSCGFQQDEAVVRQFE